LAISAMMHAYFLGVPFLCIDCIDNTNRGEVETVALETTGSDCRSV
jgi:hypothetical protein